MTGISDSHLNEPHDIAVTSNEIIYDVGTQNFSVQKFIRN